MALVLKATDGPLAGQLFDVENGMSLGRQGATINLSDPRVSSIHAHIVKTGAGWSLEDNKSKNGIRNAAGKRVESLELASGTVFEIGTSRFLVAPSTAEVAPTEEYLAPVEVEFKEPPPPEKPKKKPVYWNDALADFLEINSNKFKDKAQPLAPLEPALVLEFVRGPQANSRWIIGFGPRKIGSACADLPIWDVDAPAVCFEIFPSPDGLIFKTAHSSLVRLNGREIDNELLRVGDTIKINETLIEVDFTE